MNNATKATDHGMPNLLSRRDAVHSLTPAPPIAMGTMVHSVMIGKLAITENGAEG